MLKEVAPERWNPLSGATPFRKGGKGVARFIPRAILAFLWNSLSGATPFRNKKKKRKKEVLRKSERPWLEPRLGSLGDARE